MLRLHRGNAILPQDLVKARAAAERITGLTGVEVVGELCYYVAATRDLDERERRVLEWYLAETFEPHLFGAASRLSAAATVIEIGPRLSFETAWASTALSILEINGVAVIDRIERSRRFGFSVELSAAQIADVAAVLHDRMVETVYAAPLTTFDTGVAVQPVAVVSLLEGGIEELRRVNRERGLAMDEQDLERFRALFVDQLRRNPTVVELFQLAQGNSEHCRHGFFRGRLIGDAGELPDSLMTIVKEPWRRNPNNSVIAFHDDSSAIRGAAVRDLIPTEPGVPGPMRVSAAEYHLTLTAETHNHPSGVAPYPGAATGTGGRIRDNQAVGRGGIVGVSGAAYCVGNLHLSEDHVWERDGRTQPSTLAAPLDILVEASNGASDYGNCFGEPLIYGFVRSFGMDTANGYRSWFKPVMYSVGAGQIDSRHTEKGAPVAGLLVVQIGGPAYRIGMGGGSASSLMAGENEAALDFDSVQRGNPEMEQRMHRVLRACIELGDGNPIVSAHDLGAGGDCNALPEIAYPAGARIDLRAIPVADRSLSVLEIWGNESQERNAILIRPEDLGVVRAIAERERAPIAVVGEIRADGRLLLHDDLDGSDPVDLPLEPILGDVAAKEIRLQSAVLQAEPALDFTGVTVAAALDRVLRLPSVASKAYLTRKVDRCVTGRVAQQQCVGPNQLPLSNFAVTAQTLLGSSGTALALGEQPLKGLIDPAAMARMAVAEAVLNLAGARITALADVRCSANWMWAAKLPGEGSALHSAASAMSDIMVELGVAVDGGKDSLSMAVVGENGEHIKAPGELVIAAYAPMPDVRVKATPDLKAAGNALVFVDLAAGRARLGGSALAQAWQQLGTETPDVEDAALLGAAFAAVQDLLSDGSIVSLHDRSDGGVVTTLVEMAFAGNLGIDVDLQSDADVLGALFAEEIGLVLETAHGESVVAELQDRGVAARVVGSVTAAPQIRVRHNGAVVVDTPMVELREIWDDTSTRIDRLQADPACVDEELRATARLLIAPKWNLTFMPEVTDPQRLASDEKPRMAVLRDQGSNGDRELAAAFHAAGFDVWDVTMTDLLQQRVSLDIFRGVAFPGGFSYGDVLDAGKAWAGIVRFQAELSAQFERFHARPNTFSLGVCNGAQLMALMGWVPHKGAPDLTQPRFIRNRSGRFECRFVTVEITPSPSILLAGMEGSRLGVWVAHGEGRLHVAGGELDPALSPMCYVDPEGNPTEVYPFNPNGSPAGLTGLTSTDGRHLAIMPHPERVANQLWQWPWLPAEWRALPASPWLRMFQNAYDWCVSGIEATSAAL